MKIENDKLSKLIKENKAYLIYYKEDRVYDLRIRNKLYRLQPVEALNVLSLGAYIEKKDKLCKVSLIQDRSLKKITCPYCDSLYQFYAQVDNIVEVLCKNCDNTFLIEKVLKINELTNNKQEFYYVKLW